MGMVVRVAGNRCIDEIGRAVGTVLQSERRAGGVVDKSDPSNLTRIGPFLSRMPLAGKAEVGRSVAHGGVIGGEDRVLDRGGFRRCGGKRGGEGGRLFW